MVQTLSHPFALQSLRPMPTLHSRAVFIVKASNDQGWQFVTRVHDRLVHLPPTCCITSLAAVEANDIGKIVQLTRTVARASSVQTYESARTYNVLANMFVAVRLWNMPILNDEIMHSSNQNRVRSLKKAENFVKEPTWLMLDLCILRLVLVLDGYHGLF
jgi:hypothetical protein